MSEDEIFEELLERSEQQRNREWTQEVAEAWFEHAESKRKLPMPLSKFFTISRRTKAFVWLRPLDSTGSSVRVTASEFRAQWLPVSKRDGLDVTVYFKKTAPSTGKESKLDLEFKRGYYLAVATLVRLHGCEVEARETLAQFGDFNPDGIDEYTLKVLRPLAKEMKRLNDE